MELKNLKNLIPQLQNKFAIDEDIIYGKSLLKSCQHKILRMISDLSLRNESKYRDLFYFEDDVANFKLLEKRFIFLLLKILQNDIINKIDDDLQIFINPIYDQPQKYINYIEKNYFFYTHIKVIIIFKKLLTQEFSTIFFWSNKLLLEEYANFKIFNLVDFAIKKISQTNHTMFLKIKNAKKYHFFNYLQGLVESISSKFSIVRNNQQDSEDLLQNSKIFLQINYDNVAVFAVNSSYNQTIITTFDQKTQSYFDKKCLVSEMPIIKIISKEKVIKIWQKVAQILRTNFQDFWTKQDKLYVLIKTVKHLFTLEDSEINENFFTITTSKKVNTYFFEVHNIKIFDDKKQEGLNFSWFFNAHNFKFQISNFTYETVKILDENTAIAQKILNNLAIFSNNFKILSSNRFYLKQKINSVINAVFYDFHAAYIYRQTETICEISILNILVANFIIDWATKTAFGKLLTKIVS